MGVRQSPFATTRMFSLSMESMFGNRKDPSNIFGWTHIKLNLPGNSNYNPADPWVSKRTADNKIPPEAFTFVDGIRITGRTEKVCDQATREVASSSNYLGEQEAARKRRATARNADAWIGAIFRSDKNTIGILTSQEKWDRAKVIVGKWKNYLEVEVAMLNCKELKKDRGFMVHMSMVYPALVPYLKGMHLSLEMWRPDRYSQGWKLSKNDWARLQMHFIEKGIDPLELPSDITEAPEYVKRALRLKQDMYALSELLKDEHPPLRVIRSKTLKALGVAFADASGLGRGSSTMGNRKNPSIRYMKTPHLSVQSSNFREFHNLVETLEKEHASGNLDNLEMFVCTDNEVTERAFYKGNSKSP